MLFWDTSAYSLQLWSVRCKMAFDLNPWLVAGVVAVVLLPLLVLIVDAVLSSRPADAPPVWKGGYPIITHFLSFARNPIHTIRAGYAACGPIFTMRIAHYNFTFMIGAEAHAPFFRANDDELSQNEPYKFMTPIFGKGIVFDAPIEMKDQQLKFVAGALKGSALQTYVKHIISETDAYFREHLGESGEVDLLDAMSYLTILTASRCLLGAEVRERLFGEVYALLRQIDEGINPIAIINPNLPLPSFRRRDEARAKLAEVFGGIIAERRRRPDADKPEDMLQAFIDAEYKDGTQCTDDQITGMLVGVLFAGQHTSSITSTWTILNLLHQPQLYTRAMKEQVAVLGTSPASTDGMDMKKVQEMNFLHNCMKESLRQAPPLIMLMRMVHKPVKVGKITIPVGHYVFSSPAVTMNLPDESEHKSFTNPEKYDPDRYEEPRKEGRKDFAFCAFGGGKHGCLGEQFGYLQVKTIVSMFMRRYEVETLGPLPTPDYTAMVVGPVQTNNATRVRYKLRSTPLSF